MTSSPRLVAVVGPTASGKSAVAMAAVRAVSGVELVSVDAFQVYRGMDIGTAKPTVSERFEVPHHLIDLVDPDQTFTVAEYQQAFTGVRDDLAERGVHGILVGGTGLYHRAAIDGLTLPGQWPDLRRELEAEAAAAGTPSLHAHLRALDPVAADRMEPSNTRRVVRALEVCLGSGQPFSSFGPGMHAYPSSSVVQIGLRWQRDALAERISRRVRTMIAEGFVDEVRGLFERWRLSRTASQALGYAEMAEVAAGRMPLGEAMAHVELRTRQLSVRQERWFRRDPRIRWVDVSSDPVAEASAAVVAALVDPNS